MDVEPFVTTLKQQSFGPYLPTVGAKDAEFDLEKNYK